MIIKKGYNYVHIGAVQVAIKLLGRGFTVILVVTVAAFQIQVAAVQMGWLPGSVGFAWDCFGLICLGLLLFLGFGLLGVGS